MPTDKLTTVLLIEDEHQMRTLIAVMLEAAGYRVLEAADRQEAINVWKRESASIDLLLVDVWLPGSTGPDIVGFFRKDHPEVAALFISGMNPAVQPEIKKLIRESEVLPKPFTREQLVASVERALSSATKPT